MSEIRPLLMRSNRLLGAALVENNLIRVEDLEAANERLLEQLQAGDKGLSILGILLWERKALREEDLLAHLIEEHGIGLIDLRACEVPEDVLKVIDPAVCRATWSVPFDREDEFHFIATAYYLSPAVRAYWEKRLDGPILWYGAGLDGIREFLDALETPASSRPEPAASA
jgi:hypothetical protein